LEVGDPHVEMAIDHQHVPQHQGTAGHHRQARRSRDHLALALLIDPHTPGADLEASGVAGEQNIALLAWLCTDVGAGLDVEGRRAAVDAGVGRGVEVEAVGAVGALDALVARRLTVEDVAVDAGEAGVPVLAAVAWGLAGYAAARPRVLVAPGRTHRHAAEKMQEEPV
jgi:hypothetical protein